MIFGAKIQIIRVIFPFKNSQKSYFFSLKIQILFFKALYVRAYLGVPT